MARRRWQGDVVIVSNPRFVEGSPEHELYKLKQKKYYHDTIDAQRNRARVRVARKRERNQQWMVNHMQGKSCSCCGVTDPRVLAFDHLDDVDKFANIADLVSRGASLEKLINEVDKCRILCHNCHMVHTIKQAGGSYHSKLKPISEEEFMNKYKDFLQ